MEFSKSFFVVSQPKERYFRSSYDYFKQNENIIISVEGKRSNHFLTGLSTMSHFFDRSVNDEPKDVDPSINDEPKDVDPSINDEPKDVDSVSLEGKQYVDDGTENFEKNPFEGISANSTRGSESVGPYFYFPNVKSI